MPTQIITMYCFFDELLKAVGHKDDPQTVLSTAEVMTVALVAAEFFTGNQQKALDFLTDHHYIKPFSKSRFNRRMHSLPDTLWQFALFVLAQAHQQTNSERLHIVDTFPVPVCHNIRISRCKIYQDEAFRGYCARCNAALTTASKKEYYYGLKACLIVTEAGLPVELLVELLLVPISRKRDSGCTADIAALRDMPLHLPDDSTLFGDGGFLDRTFETVVAHQAGIELIVPRRKNMKEQLDGVVAFVCQKVRKQVETTFSQLTARMARRIHVVTPRGFELKIMLTVLAYSING